jgi:hypothetical protein
LTTTLALNAADHASADVRVKADAPAAGTLSISIEPDGFAPRVAHGRVGEPVHFTNNDQEPHGAATVQAETAADIGWLAVPLILAIITLLTAVLQQVRLAPAFLNARPRLAILSLVILTLAYTSLEFLRTRHNSQEAQKFYDDLRYDLRDDLRAAVRAAIGSPAIVEAASIPEPSAAGSGTAGTAIARQYRPTTLPSSIAQPEGAGKSAGLEIDPQLLTGIPSKLLEQFIHDEIDAPPGSAGRWRIVVLLPGEIGEWTPVEPGVYIVVCPYHEDEWVIIFIEDAPVEGLTPPAPDVARTAPPPVDAGSTVPAPPTVVATSTEIVAGTSPRPGVWTATATPISPLTEYPTDTPPPTATPWPTFTFVPTATPPPTFTPWPPPTHEPTAILPTATPCHSGPPWRPAYPQPAYPGPGYPGPYPPPPVTAPTVDPYAGCPTVTPRPVPPLPPTFTPWPTLTPPPTATPWPTFTPVPTATMRPTATWSAPPGGPAPTQTTLSGIPTGEAGTVEAPASATADGQPEVPGTTLPRSSPSPGLQPCRQILGIVPSGDIRRALAEPERIGGYNRLLDPGKPESPSNPRRTWLSIRHPGVRYHWMWNSLVCKATCP